MPKIKKMELLAPGGSPEGIRACIRAGADAVYTGGSRFGARAYADNPDESELLDAIDYCHLHHRRLYLTVNTLLKEKELEKDLYDYLAVFYERGVDAVLVQDLGVLSFLRREFPDLELHASTQMSVSSTDGAAQMYRLGCSRIVPAREMTLEQIRKIHEEVPVELECFAHGALCYSYSGQCLMSSMIGGRSGNRGRCAQPCRMQYRCEGKKGYFLSLKDLSALDMLKELREAGVCSLKIEGRMKRSEYAAGVTQIYRKYLDLLESGRDIRILEEDRRDLMDLFNRGGFSEGYYTGKKGPSFAAAKRPNHAGTQALRLLQQSGSGTRGRTCAEALEDLWKGDVLETRDQGGENSSSITLSTDVKAGDTVLLSLPAGLKKGTVLPRVRCERLLKRIREQFLEQEQMIPIRGKMTFQSGEPMRLQVCCGEISAEVVTDAPQAARKTAVTRQDLEGRLRKTKDSPFEFETIEIDAGDGLFCPMSAVSELRRNGLSCLQEQILRPYRRSMPVHRREELPADAKERRKPEFSAEYCDEKLKFSASVQTEEQLHVVLKDPTIRTIYLDCLMFLPPSPDVDASSMPEHMPFSESYRKAAEKVHREGKECGLILPGVWREGIIRRVYDQFFSGEQKLPADVYLLRSPAQIETLRRWGIDPNKVPLIADTNLYSFSRESRRVLKNLGFARDTVPAELNLREIRERTAAGSEMIIYGRELLMTTASCLRKNLFGCSADNRMNFLTDRTGAVFPVKCCCGICSNQIYNSAVLNLLDETENLHKEGISCLRAVFTTENENETRNVLSMLQGFSLQEKPEGGYTKGHYRRGVE